MSDAVQNFIIGISGFIIIVMLGIIGFFLQRLYIEFKEMNVSIFMIKETVSNNIGDVNNLKINCTERHVEIHERLNSLDRKSLGHEKRIVKLETRKL